MGEQRQELSSFYPPTVCAKLEGFRHWFSRSKEALNPQCSIYRMGRCLDERTYTAKYEMNTQYTYWDPNLMITNGHQGCDGVNAKSVGLVLPLGPTNILAM